MTTDLMPPPNRKNPLARKKNKAAERERAAGLRTPRPDLFSPPPPNRQRPAAAGPLETDELHAARFSFMGSHGGAGAGLLARLSRRAHDDALAVFEAGDHPGPGPFFFGVDIGTAWPWPGTRPSPPDVVMVCRTTMSGLEWARDVARQYLSGNAPSGVRLLGLVSMADQPGKLPPPVVNSLKVLDGVYGAHWQIPYLPQYRLYRESDTTLPATHPAIDNTLQAIRNTLLKGI